MKENLKIEKACSFFISDIHFITMMLPYINKEVEKNISIFTIFEKNQIKNIKLILEKINLKEINKNKILKINWNKTQLNLIEKINIDKLLEKSNDVEILVSGNENYINKVGKILEKYLEKNKNKYENKKIKIIDCYEVTDFNNNIQEILDNHDFIINTSGEHEKEDIYYGYKKSKSEEKIIS